MKKFLILSFLITLFVLNNSLKMKTQGCPRFDFEIECSTSFEGKKWKTSKCCRRSDTCKVNKVSCAQRKSDGTCVNLNWDTSCLKPE